MLIRWQLYYERGRSERERERKKGGGGISTINYNGYCDIKHVCGCIVPSDKNTYT